MDNTILNKFLDSFLGSTDRWKLVDCGHSSTYTINRKLDGGTLATTVFYVSLKNDNNILATISVNGFLASASASDKVDLNVSKPLLVTLHVVDGQTNDTISVCTIEENEYKEEYKFLKEYVRTAVLMQEDRREEQDRAKLNEVVIIL